MSKLELLIVVMGLAQLLYVYLCIRRVIALERAILQQMSSK